MIWYVKVIEKFKTSKNNVKKVLKVLLYDELKSEMEVKEKPKKERKTKDDKRNDEVNA